MRSRAGAVVLVLLAFAAAACGDDAGANRETARDWIATLEEERWADACARLADPPDGCEAVLREDYGGRELKLLGAGEYLQGDEANDNETRFAFVTSGGGEPESSTAFEVVDGDRIRLVVAVEGR